MQYKAFVEKCCMYDVVKVLPFLETQIAEGRKSYCKCRVLRNQKDPSEDKGDIEVLEQ